MDFDTFLTCPGEILDNPVSPRYPGDEGDILDG